MATLSHEALRILIHRWGDPDEYFSEMIHAPSFVTGGKFESWYVHTSPVPEKMVWQITGPDREPMIRTAEMLLSYGGIGLDLNMGCSAPDIARHGAGIAWMSKPYTDVSALVGGIRRVVDRGSVSSSSALDAARPRLGIKLRLGESEEYPKLLDFCRMLVDSGADLITLHPRVRRDKYGRPARREHVARLASDLSVPVYGNGDIMTAEDALDYGNRWPCAGIMIGRAAVQKPWIFGDIHRAEAAFCTGSTPFPSAPSFAVSRGAIDHLEVARFFLDTLAECQPPEFLISRARRFFFYYCDNFSFAHYIKMKIQRAETLDAVYELLERYFDEIPGDRILADQGSQGVV
jgi:tRNA-dihydrouridine synthase